MVAVRQTSFAAGELSPDMWGRTDSDLYETGARRLSNFVVKPQGPVDSRPGTVKLSTCKPGQDDVALVGFSYSETLVFVLELGDHYLRVHSPTTGYTGVELQTPWSTAQAKLLQTSQVGRVMVLAHKEVLAQELTMTLVGGVPTWVLTQARWYPPLDTEVGDTTPKILTPKFYSSNFRGQSGYFAGPYLLVPGLQNPDLAAVFVGDEAHKPAAWKWRYSTLFRHNVTGELVESESEPLLWYILGDNLRTVRPAAGERQLISNFGDMVVLSPDRPVSLVCATWAPTFNAGTGNYEWPPGWQHWTPVRHLFYRGWGDRYGYVGSTDDAAQDFVDVGDLPDWNTQPLMERYPTTVDELYSGFTNRVPPSAVTHHAGRRCFAVGQTVAASRIDSWDNFDVPPGSVDEKQALEYTMTSSKRMDVRSLLSHAKLLGFADEGVWSCELGLSNVQFQQEIAVGAGPLQPLVIEGAVLYVRQRGRGLFALSLDNNGNYRGFDVSWQSAHLFSSNVIAWCHQRWPYNCAWLVTDTGGLLTCTPTSKGWAWAQHTTTGVVKSIASVTTPDADVVVVAVRRPGSGSSNMGTGNSLVLERLCNPETERRFAVDSAMEATGTVGEVVTVTGLEHLNGLQVWVVPESGPPQGPFKVLDGEVTTDKPLEGAAGATMKVRAGLTFLPELELLDAPAARTQQKTVVSVGFEAKGTEGIWVGQDAGEKSMREWQRRQVSDSFDFPTDANIVAVVNVGGTWAKSGRAVLQQRLPLPLTVLGITRELRAGG